MLIKKNPFYILEIPVTATRKEIISKVDEKSFFDDSGECEKAQSILLNPARRLEAEINWFPEVLAEDEQDILQYQIDNGELIDSKNLRSISKLNAILYNFDVVFETSKLEDLNYIMDTIHVLDDTLDSLNIDDILEDINSGRIIAGISPTTYSDIERVIPVKREEVRRNINEKLGLLTDEKYVDFINGLAWKYINRYNSNHGMVLDDVINQYEIRMQILIEQETAKLKELEELIKYKTELNLRSSRVNELIKCLREWERYVKPLQLKARSEGKMHGISENMAISLRTTCVYIHNEFNDINNAAKLSDALQDIFVDLPEFAEMVANDNKTLERNKAAKAIEAENAENKVVSIIKGIAAALGNRILFNIVALIIIAIIISLATMCGGDDSGSDEAYNSNDTYEDEYYDETEPETEAEKYVEKDMPESGYVFNNTCDSRPTYIMVKNVSDDAYVVHVEAIDQDGELDGFIAPNSTGQIYVPLGLCNVDYKYGPKWYGKKDMFGDEEYSDGSSLESFDATHYYTITVGKD